jgi:hypothetical protein
MTAFLSSAVPKKGDTVTFDLTFDEKRHERAARVRII